MSIPRIAINGFGRIGRTITRIAKLRRHFDIVAINDVAPLGGVSAFRIDGYGVWSYTDTLMTDSLQLARFPLTEGDTWAASPDVAAEVVSMEETVTVPDGTFENVLHISTTEVDTLGNQTVDDYWYAPGVGLVSHGKIMQNGPLVLYELSEDLAGHLTF